MKTETIKIEDVDVAQLEEQRLQLSKLAHVLNSRQRYKVTQGMRDAVMAVSEMLDNWSDTSAAKKKPKTR